MFSFIFDPQLALHYDIPTYSAKNSDTTDRYGQIITVDGVGVVGGDFSHTPRTVLMEFIAKFIFHEYSRTPEA